MIAIAAGAVDIGLLPSFCHCQHPRPRISLLSDQLGLRRYGDKVREVMDKHGGIAMAVPGRGSHPCFYLRSEAKRDFDYLLTGFDLSADSHFAFLADQNP